MQRRTWLRLIVLLAAALLALGCKVFAPPLYGPERSGTVWHEVTATHVVLATDLDVQDARELAARAETTFEALRHVAFRGVPAPRHGLRIVYFTRSADFSRVAPRSAAGYFVATLSEDPEEEGAVVLGASGRSQTLLAHELVHALVQRALPMAPRWLDEGLAEYYETIELRDGAASFGGPPGRTAISRLLAAAAGVPDAQTLLSIPWHGFASDESSLPFVHEAKAFADYVGSRALAGLLVEHPDYLDRLDRIFAARTVEPGKSVYETAFAGIPGESLEAAYRAYLGEPHVPIKVPHASATGAPPLEVREMTPAEIHVLWARLLWHGGGKSARSSADEHIDRAVALSPKSAEAWFWKGWFQRQTEDLAGAELSIDNALRLEPEVPRYLLGAVLVADAFEKRSLLSDARREKRDRHLARLSRVARSMGGLRRIAKHKLDAGEPEEALAITRRALAAHPQCVKCLSTRIRAALQLDKYDVAAFAAERIIALSGDQDGDSWQSLHDSFLESARCARGKSPDMERDRRRRERRLMRERDRFWHRGGPGPNHPEDGDPVPRGYGDVEER